MVLGLLLGNSSVRYGVHDGAGIRARGRIEWPELAARGGEIRRAALELGARCAIVGSVRDDLFPAVELWIPRQLLPASFARRDFVVPIENRYERPEEAGTDRLLAAVAARERARGRCAVVVDFGTAISITVVSPEGAFLGGLIAAGGRAVQRGLEELTPKLPAVPPGLSAVPPGVPAGFIQRGITAGLQAGLAWQVAGGVRAMISGIVQELVARHGAAPASLVLATGGEAALHAPRIPEIAEVVPDLTLEGLFLSDPGLRG